MKKELIVFILIIFMIISLIVLVPMAVAGVRINEVMYKPSDDWGGRYNEWIELYNPTESNITLENWNLSQIDEGKPKNRSIPPSVILSKDYLILARKPDIFNNTYNICCPVLNVSFGYGLNNNGDTIKIYDGSGSLVDSFSYDNSYGADGNGKTLEKIDPMGQNIQENWGESVPDGGTPGAENSLFGTCDLEISVLTDYDIWPIEDDSVIVKWKIEIKNNTPIEEINFTFSYWIEDAFGNIVKNPCSKTWNETGIFPDGYSYTKTFHNEDAGGYIIFANITNINCLDLKTSNNLDTKAVIVQGEQQQGQQQSYLAITDAPEEATFGDIVDVKINVYRGDTGKYAVYARIEQDNGCDISEESTLHVLTKYVNYSMKIPIQLKLNCDERYKEGNYFIILEGLDESVTQEIYLGGMSSLCGSTSQSTTSSSSTSAIASQGGLIYEVIAPSTAIINQEIEVVIKIENSEDYEQNVDVWSYVYRGPKCYSCNEEKNETREQNKQSIVIKAQDLEEITLTNIVNEAEEGDYKLKVKILKEGYSTPKEFIFDIFLDGKEDEQIEKETSFSDSETESSTDKITGNIVRTVETGGSTVLKITPYLLSLLCLLIAFYVIKIK